ncbi:MAG: carboxypeptidase regulatory-like domain-containing protein [Janthinobacterium lividum]
MTSPVMAQLNAPLSSSAGNLQTAQGAIGANKLSGSVVDPSGALVPGAAVHLVATGQSASSSHPADSVTDAGGHFTIPLDPGTYTITIVADGFDPLIQTVQASNRPLTVQFRLLIATTSTQLEVRSNEDASTAASDNRSALVFKGEQLDTLSSNDSTLQQQVQAMSGGSGSLYVDGFSGGRFPPKDTIREIRINQNPFSTQYEDLGYGRIEILTKPGSNKLHGNAFSSGSTKAFNSLNPYTGAEPPYFLLSTRGDLNGAIGKATSFFVSGERNDQHNNAVVNAFNPDGTPLSVAVPAPVTDYTLSGRMDRQLGRNNTLIGRYEYNKSIISNSGVGLLVLPSEGTTNSTTTQTLQLGNTQVIGPNLLSETRFQYVRSSLEQTPNSTAPTLIVQGSFSGGGSPSQSLVDKQDRFEFQEYLSLARGSHFLRFGARYRLLRESNVSTANYNGQYTFASLTAYQAGTPSLFSLTAGQSQASLLNGDLAAYLDDEWKLRKNLTANLGFRLESQTSIPDGVNPAPRAGISWAVGQTEKHQPFVTLRANAGIFYQRFAATNLITATRQNGISQQSYFINNPAFYPTIPNPAQLTSTPATPYSVSPHLRVAAENIASLSVERSLGKLGSVTATYYAVRGTHQYNSNNVNAPVTDGSRPLGRAGDVYEFASDGVEKAQSFALNTNLQLTKRLSVFVFYGARRQHNDTFGATSFPSQPYNVSGDYGPSGLSMQPVGNRLFANASLKLPLHFSADSFVGAFSRSRFNITTGTDRNGDTQYNDRPAFATNPGPTSLIYRTAYGTFDAVPQPGEALIPYNYAAGPRTVFTAARVNRDFKFGPRPETPKVASTDAKSGPVPPPAEPRYSLSFALEAVNALNNTNPGTPVGVLTSPYFGRSISSNSVFGLTSAANRVVFLSTSFHF